MEIDLVERYKVSIFKCISSKVVQSSKGDIVNKVLGFRALLPTQTSNTKHKNKQVKTESRNHTRTHIVFS